ncbi:MAG: type II secretion system protein M [Proteobacteria bacterium]|nr:type II secretion system protein M [Pseudomonadota bacterium]
MKDWFESLQSRERQFVTVGAAAVAVALFYALVWMPLDNGHTTLLANIANWERSLAELRPLKGLLSASGNASAAQRSGTQQTPVVIVDQTLRARGLDRSLKRSQPTTRNGIRVEFESVPFDDLVLWLGDLSKEYAMHVSSGSLSTASRAGPGLINATLTLERLP